MPNKAHRSSPQIGCSAQIADRRLRGLRTVALALLALLVFAASAKADARPSVDRAAHDAQLSGSRASGPNRLSSAAPGAQGALESKGTQPAEAGPQAAEGTPPTKTSSTEETPKEETPPAEETAKEESQTPPAEEAPKEESQTPPAEEAPKEETPPAEEAPKEESQTPPAEEAEQDQSPPSGEKSTQEAQNSPAAGVEEEGLGTRAVTEGEAETTDSEAGREGARHAGGAEEAAQRTGVLEEGDENAAQRPMEEAARPSPAIEGAEAAIAGQDPVLEQPGGAEAEMSILVGDYGPAAISDIVAGVATLEEFAEHAAAQLTGELSCELSALAQNSEGCNASWPGNQGGLTNLPDAILAVAIASAMTTQTGAPAHGGHGSSSLGSAPAGPAPGSVPSGSSGAAAGGASGVAPSPGVTQTGVLLAGATRAMHRLQLSFHPWRTTYFALIPERPG
jgi:hypothetical protein